MNTDLRKNKEPCLSRKIIVNRVFFSSSPLLLFSFS